jgi:hypothetical protein
MSIIKSFLVAISVSPLFFIPFQLPSQSQCNSKCPPGSSSGAANGGSTGTSLSSPTAPAAPPTINISTSTAGVTATVVGGNVQVSVTSAAQASVNTAASQITLGATGDAAQQAVAVTLTSPSLTPTQVAAAVSSINTVAPAIATLPPAGGTIPIPGGTAVVTTTSLVKSTPAGGSTTESTTKIVVTTAAGAKEVTLPAGTINLPAAISAATAILVGGGTPAQALTAGTLAGASQNTSAAVNLVIALASVLFGLTANLPGTVPIASLPNSATLVASLNLNSLLAKPLNLEKQILIAQGSGTKVDVNKLNQAILAYNKLIDTSSPEGVLALSQNPEFIEIGQTLRKLRSALVR